MISMLSVEYTRYLNQETHEANAEYERRRLNHRADLFLDIDPILFFRQEPDT